MPNIHEDYKYYKTELAKIEPKYLALLETVKGLEKLINLEGRSDSKPGQASISFREGSFDGFTLRDSVLSILFKAKPTPMTTRDIVDVLEGAKFKHGSKNLWNTTNTTLDRLEKKYQLVLKTDQGWVITEKGEKDITGTSVEDMAMLFSSVSTEHEQLS